MSSDNGSPNATLHNSTLRKLFTVSSTALLIIAIGLAVNTFYPLAALIGCVIIVTYLLWGPVNGLEYLGNWLFARFQRRSKLSDHPPNLTETCITHRFGRSYLRMVAVLIVYIAFFGIIGIGSTRLPILVKQMGELSSRLSTQLVSISDQAMDWVDHTAGAGTVRKLFSQEIHNAELFGAIHHHESGTPISPTEKQVIQQAVIQNSILNIEGLAAAALPVTITNFAGWMGGTIYTLIYIMSGLLLVFYFLTDGRRLRTDALMLFPITTQPTVNYLFDSFHEIMSSFIKGQVMLGVLTGFYMFIVYSVFGVPYAFLLASLFALAELLPVIGTWLGIGIGLLVILVSMDPLVALWVWIFSYGFQTIKDNILAPKVVGDVMGLHPLVIILALLICGQSAGLLGVLIALPLASLVNVILRLCLRKKTESPEEEISFKSGEKEKGNA